MIIDGGRCTNVIAIDVVKGLNLSTTHHPAPYQLQWLNSTNGIKLTQQVLVPFSIGSYKDQVLCDIIPMTASHILMGRPWAYDRKVIHYGGTNEYRVQMGSRSHKWAPLSPMEVAQAQHKLRQAQIEKGRVRKLKGKYLSDEKEGGHYVI